MKAAQIVGNAPTLARNLMAAGYRPTPIRPGKKSPAMADWQTAQLTPADAKKFRGRGIGILTGQGKVPVVAFDVDSVAPAIVEGFVAYCREHLGDTVERVGNAPKRLLVYRAAEAGWRKAASPWFTDGAGKRHRLEVLSLGQQFVAYHVHPDTGRPYEWIDFMGGIEHVPAESLPVVQRDQVEAALAEFERLAEAAGLRRIGAATSGAHSTSPDSDAWAYEAERADALERIASDPETVADLRAALAFRLPDGSPPPGLDPDNRDDWIAVGHALKAADLFDLWADWSSQSDKWDDGRDDPVNRWAGLAGDRSDYRAIFAKAQAAGWINPRKGKPMMPVAGTVDLSEPPAITDAVRPTAAPQGDSVPVPEPFPGPMADVVAAACQTAPKPQPELTTLAALIGMAASIPSGYHLPDNGRLNLYGVGVLETGGGKDRALRVAEHIADAASARIIARAASGPGLEDSLAEDAPMLSSLDEVAHMLAAVNGSKAPGYLTELAGNLLQLFTASSSKYRCRVRAAAKADALVGPRVIEHPCFSFLGMATPEKLGKAFTSDNIADGLMGRVLFVFGRPGVRQRMPGPFSLPDSIAIRCAAIAARFAQGADPSDPFRPRIAIRYGEGVEALLVRLMGDLSEAPVRNTFTRALRARTYEKLIRIAGVLAVFDDPAAPTIRREHVDWALQFAQASDAAIERFADEYMVEGPILEDARRVLDVVRKIISGTVRVQRPSDIDARKRGLVTWSLALKASHIDAERFARAVGHLIEAGEVERVNGTDGAHGRTVQKLLRPL